MLVVQGGDWYWRIAKLDRLIDSRAVSYLYATVTFYLMMICVWEEYVHEHNHRGLHQWNRIHKKLQNPLHGSLLYRRHIHPYPFPYPSTAWAKVLATERLSRWLSSFPIFQFKPADPQGQLQKRTCFHLIWGWLTWIIGLRQQARKIAIFTSALSLWTQVLSFKYDIKDISYLRTLSEGDKW